jgi:hypothetical protein
MTKYPHFPIWISSLYSIIGEDLFELESVFRQCDIVGLGVPFFEATEFMTVSKLSVDQSLSFDMLSQGNVLDKQSTAAQDVEVRIPAFENVTGCLAASIPFKGDLRDSPNNLPFHRSTTFLIIIRPLRFLPWRIFNFLR